MTPLQSALVGMVVRWLVVFLASRGIMVSETLSGDLTLALIAGLPLLWSAWRKYQVDQKLAVARLQVELAARSRIA